MTASHDEEDPQTDGHSDGDQDAQHDDVEQGHSFSSGLEPTMLATLIDGLAAGAVLVADTLYEAAFVVYERFYNLYRYLHGRPY